METDYLKVDINHKKRILELLVAYGVDYFTNRLDSKGRAYYYVTPTIRRSGRMIVTPKQLKKSKERI